MAHGHSKGSTQGLSSDHLEITTPQSLLSQLDYDSDFGSSSSEVVPQSQNPFPGSQSHLVPQLYYSSSASGSSSDHEMNNSSNDIMKYRTSYVNLLVSFRSLELEHQNLLQAVASGDFPLALGNGRLQLDNFLDEFALQVVGKKAKFDQEQTLDGIQEGSAVFTVRRWKRRYAQLMEALELLHQEYLMVQAVIDKADLEQRLGSPKLRSIMESRLAEVEEDYTMHDGIYEANDMGITISKAFASDLINQCRIYRGELEKQAAIRERLYYVHSRAKEQSSKLHIYADALQDELCEVVKKTKAAQAVLSEAFATEEAAEARQQEVEEAINETNDILGVAGERINLQGKIEELERILKEEESRRKKLHNKLQEIIGNIRVYCRVRPHPKCFMKVSSDDKLLLNSELLPKNMSKFWSDPMKCFIFDKVFNQQATQGEVFDSVAELITSFVDGFNVCIMAYGQTGSGKTHTMMGTPGDPGINRRAIKELLRVCQERKQWTYQLALSMVEIYGEDVRDLLSKTGESGGETTLHHVKILSTQDDDITLQGLTEHAVLCEEDIIRYLERGETNRKVGSTLMNSQSSRSHLVLLLKVMGENNVHKTSSKGVLTLCDLAGSESNSAAGAAGTVGKGPTSSRISAEAAAINKSLTSLGRVFDTLRRRQKPCYRETKLTFMLKPTLGGDAKCLLLVNVRSEPDHIEESLRALNFAQNATQIGLHDQRLPSVSGSASGGTASSGGTQQLHHHKTTAAGLQGRSNKK